MDYAKITKPVLARYPKNPILQASDFPVRMRAVYNSSAVKLAPGKYVMLCRCNQLNHRTLLWGADSKDGLTWKLRPEPFDMPPTDDWKAHARSVYYDPRITYLEGRHLVLLAVYGDFDTRVALFESRDQLQSIRFLHWLNVPDNRNMVIFPEKSRDGRYMRLERPNVASKSGKGDIWLSFSPDLLHWGDGRLALAAGPDLWNYAFSGLGASTVPYRTSEGWLVLFHAVMDNCSTREYSVGAMLLDLDKPWIVRHVTRHPILFPEAEYELRGLVEHVCFPCAKIVEPDGTVKVYYGAADTCQCVALGKLKDLMYACKHW